MVDRSKWSQLHLETSDLELKTQLVPMWVVQVSLVLKMTGILKPHQALKAEGLLTEWKSKMFTLFVSHQWLAYHHPDPHGIQLQVLQGFLLGLIDRKLQIESDIISQFHGHGLTKAELSHISEGYIWLDYFSVPQLVGMTRSRELEEEQLRYIYSIPSYVEPCNVFVALVPRTMHQDTRAECSFSSWLERGWCRMEFWSHFLSVRPKMPILVVRSHESAQFTSSMWYRYPVHAGRFAIEDDKISCCQIVQAALTKHVSQLQQRRNYTAFRLYIALFEEVTGQPSQPRSLEAFQNDFGFKDLRRSRGLGPVACAVLAGDTELLLQLVAAKASIQDKAPAMPEILHMADLSPLHLALWFRSHDLQLLTNLLSLRADVEKSTMNVAPPLHFCRTAAAVELLVQHKAGVNVRGKDLAQAGPLHNMCALGAPSEVLGKLLELRADLHGSRGGLANASPLHYIAYAGDSENDLRSAQLLLNSRADMNQRVRPEGIMRALELFCRLYSRFRRPALLVRHCRDMSTTPLGWCVLFNNEKVLHLLLKARANPYICNNRGLCPIDFAKTQRMRELLQPRISDFEEIITATF